METKISKLPAIAMFCTALFIAVFLSAIAITAYIYNYTFGDVFRQLDLVLIALSVIILITVIRGIVNLCSLRANIKITDGNVDIKYFKKTKLKSATLKLGEIKQVFYVQTLFEKIVKQGTIRIYSSNNKPYSVKHVKNPAAMVEILTNNSGDEV